MTETTQYLTTKEIQAELLYMMKVLHNVLDEHDIRYTLDGGTLLGAIRHKGFIPWDDDIDILIPRPDFDRLAAHPEWAPSGMSLIAPFTKHNAFPFIKFEYNKWQAREPYLEGICEQKLWIDIFPADAVPDTDRAYSKLLKKQHVTSKIAALTYVNIDGYTKNIKSRILLKAGASLIKPFYPAAKAYAKLGSRAQELKYGSTQGVTDLCWGPFPATKPRIPVEDFDHLIDVPFENTFFKAIPSWDSYLTGLFHDYMQLPPADKRETHGIKVWAS